MRKLAIGILSAALLPLAGCGEPTSACAQVAEQKKAVLDAWCAGKDETCWYCKCHNRAEQVKVTVENEVEAFSCVPVQEKLEAACEGAVLEGAQACLENEKSCIEDTSTIEAKSKCGATKQ